MNRQGQNDEDFGVSLILLGRGGCILDQVIAVRWPRKKSRE